MDGVSIPEKEVKKCLGCKKEKDISEFTGVYGASVKYCISCRTKLRDTYLKNREKILERGKKKYAENPELFKERNHKRYDKDPEKPREYSRRRRAEKSDEVKRSKREYGKSKARYDTFASRLTILEEPTQDEEGYLLVSCAKCRKKFYPTVNKVQNRIQALNSLNGCENRIFCSDSCKFSCEVFRVQFDPHTKKEGKERDPLWARQVKERAGWKCERCGDTERLQAHHEIPIKIDYTLIRDLDNGICLCRKCHVKAHSSSGCTLTDLIKA